MSRVQIARRKMYLHQQLSNYNRVAMRLSERLHELHKYSASIARGFMSPFALAGMPVSCLSRAACFFQNQMSDAVASSVMARVRNVGMLSQNPVLSNLAQDGNRVLGALEYVQNRMPLDEISARNGLSWNALTANNPPGALAPQDKYVSSLLGKGTNINTNNQQTAAGAQPGIYYTPNQENAAIEHMVRNAYKEELRELQKAEAEEIKVIEDEITQEQQLNNTRIQVTQTELKEVEQHEKDAIDRSKATYA